MDMFVKSKVLPIAEILKKFFLIDPLNSKEFSIFLCGGSTLSQEKLRRAVGVDIEIIRSRYRYKVYYPEDMFDELMFGHDKKDLLSLENMLAESSHSVAILVSSPGTFTELGAFTNHPKLKNKLILVVDIKYKKSKSFINLGPIRHLQKKTTSKVVYLPLNQNNIRNISKVITVLCRDIAQKHPPNASLSNPILSYEFYLSLIYIFENIITEDVILIANSLSLSNDTEESINDSVKIAINSMVKEGSVSCISGKLSTTEKGDRRLIYSNRTQTSSYVVSRFLTTMRYKMLNELYRGKIGTRGKAF